MIDIHTHIIYDVDDGSDTLDESIAILKKAVSNGVTDIIFTPHYLGATEYNSDRVHEHFNILKENVEKNNLPLKVYLGNEVAIYGNVMEVFKNNEVCNLAGSKYMLIEFPMNTDVSYVIDTIYEMRIKNIIPVIAHPERCECFRKNYDRIKEAVAEGALIQCNTGSLMGIYGNTAKKIVKKLLKDKLVHFLATDTHTVKNTRYDELHKVEAAVEKIVGKYEKNKLFIYNARNIILNLDIE